MLMAFKAINSSFSESYGDSLAADKSIANPDCQIGEPESKTRLAYEISTNEYVTLKTGGELREMLGYLNITPDTDWKEGAKSIGGMSYSEAKGCYYISTQLPRSQFENLIQSARRGILPETILVMVKQKYLKGNEWDNTDKFNVLSVVWVEFSGCLAVRQSGTIVSKAGDAHLNGHRLIPHWLNILLSKLLRK